MPPLNFLMFLIASIAVILVNEAWAYRKGSATMLSVFAGKGIPAIYFAKLISSIVIFILVIKFFLQINPGFQAFGFRNVDHSFLPILVLGFLAIITGCHSARKILPWKNEKNDHANHISTGVLSFYFLLRVTHLALYECFLRGCLLYVLLPWIGMPVAILLNLSVYVLLHGHSNSKEIAGSIPFGALLCFLTLWYGSVWPAVMIHLCLALSYEIRIIKITGLNKKCGPQKTFLQ